VPKWALRAFLAIGVIEPLIVWAPNDPLSHYHITDSVESEELANFCRNLGINANIITQPIAELRPGIGRVDHAGNNAAAALIVGTVICQSSNGVNFFGLKYFQKLLGELSWFWHTEFP